MARIKINDLPKTMKISRQDLRRITGGSAVHKADTSLMAFPQVCLTPVEPSGPIPTPYASDAASSAGSKSISVKTSAGVFIKGEGPSEVSGQAKYVLDFYPVKPKHVK